MTARGRGLVTRGSSSSQTAARNVCSACRATHERHERGRRQRGTQPTQRAVRARRHPGNGAQQDNTTTRSRRVKVPVVSWSCYSRGCRLVAHCESLTVHVFPLTDMSDMHVGSRNETFRSRGPIDAANTAVAYTVHSAHRRQRRALNPPSTSSTLTTHSSRHRRHSRPAALQSLCTPLCFSRPRRRRPARFHPALASRPACKRLPTPVYACLRLSASSALLATQPFTPHSPLPPCLIQLPGLPERPEPAR